MIHAFEEYLKISNEYDIKAKKIDAYLENAKRELLINLKQSELKVIEESGTDDDLTLLKEAAEEGFVAKIKSAIKAIIDAFIKFMTDLKDRVVRIIVTQKSRNTLRQIEKKVKLTPFLSKRKVKIDKVEDQIKVIREFESKCDKETAKALSKLKSADDIQIGALRDTFDNKFRKVCMASAAATTVTLGMLVSIINKQIESLPSVITDIERENSGALKKLMDSAIDDEAAATCKAAMTAAANFRTKLAKTEANIYVDSLGDNIAVAKKALKIDKTITAKNTLTGESVEDDDYDDYTMESEYGDFDFDEALAMLESDTSLASYSRSQIIPSSLGKKNEIIPSSKKELIIDGNYKEIKDNKFFDKLKKHKMSKGEIFTISAIGAYVGTKVVVGAIIPAVIKSNIRKLLKLYEKMHPDCIPFGNLTKETYNYDEASEIKYALANYKELPNDSLGRIAEQNAYANDTKYNTKFIVFKDDHDKVVMYIQKNKLYLNKGKYELFINNNSYNKHRDYYMAAMALSEGIGHEALNRFTDDMEKVYNANKKFIKETNMLKESYNDDINDIIDTYESADDIIDRIDSEETYNEFEEEAMDFLGEDYYEESYNDELDADSLLADLDNILD